LDPWHPHGRASGHRSSAGRYCSPDLGGALEAQFLGNRQTRILYLEIAFRQLAQRDLSVDKYCRQMKTMTDTLRTLGPPITDESLVLNLLLQRASGCSLRLRGGGGVATTIARVDAVAHRAARVALRVALSGHPSTTRGLAPFTCGPGCPRVPWPLPHLSAGLLCRSTSGGALGSSPASTGAPSAPEASGPTRVGALN
jgi:hypothetical protein